MPTLDQAPTGTVGEAKIRLVATDGDKFFNTNKSLAGLSVNVKDAPFNAVGDGVTDDTAAIQAAIDTGKHIIAGDRDVFLISSPISPQSNQLINLNGSTIKNDGPTSTMLALDGMDRVTIYNGTLDGNITNRGSIFGIFGISGVAATNCCIRNVLFEGMGAGAGRTKESGACINFEANDDTGANGVTGPCFGNLVEHCIFDDEFVSFGIRFKTQWDFVSAVSECYNNHAIYNTFISIGKSAVEMAGHLTHSCTAEYNHVVASKIDGMDIDKGAFDCSMSFNTINDVNEGLDGTNQFGGIAVASIDDGTGPGNGELYATGNRIIGNIIKTVKGNGINLAGARHTIVQGNTILEAGLIGIQSTNDGTSNINSNNNIITGNIVRGLGKYRGSSEGVVPIGILLNNADDCTVGNNDISASIYRGIYVSRSLRAIVSSNKIEGVDNSTASYPIYVSTSSGTRVRGNTLTQSGSNNTDATIRILNSDEIIVSENICYVNGVTDYAIRTLGTSNNTIVVNNIGQNHNGTAVVRMAGTGTEFVVNGNIGDAGSTIVDGTTDNTAVIRHRIEAANADTSGATIGQLETEVNELKAALRNQSIIT